jgi:hypothetical protein
MTMIGVADFSIQIELIYYAATRIQEPCEFKSLFRMLSVTSLSDKRIIQIESAQKIIPQSL